MKGYLVLLALIALSSASNTFLRNLDEAIKVTVNSIKAEDDAKCAKTVATFSTTMELNLKAASKIVSFDAKLTLANGSNKVEYKKNGIAEFNVDTPTAQDITFDLDGDNSSIKPGYYTFSKLEDVTATTVATFDTAKATITYKYIPEYEVATKQTEASQEVDAKSDKTEEKQFTVELAEEYTGTVFFYPNSTCAQPISCSVSKKTVTCTPTTADMEDGKEYDIYYEAGCEAAAKAGVKVSFSASSFVTFSKYALVVLGLFLF